jgi:hypothetical protein
MGMSRSSVRRMAAVSFLSRRIVSLARSCLAKAESVRRSGALAAVSDRLRLDLSEHSTQRRVLSCVPL